MFEILMLLGFACIGFSHLLPEPKTAPGPKKPLRKT